MLSRGLLLARGGKKIPPGSIGTAGEQGFGVGVYPGDPSDLTAVGLSPMSGCEDPASPNYGNYEHTLGSIMVFIPAFCYRIGRPTAPSYSRDGANALEIRDASLGEGDGWILHRAFIDGDKQKFGFFVDKYLCSKKSDNANVAVSVKGGNQISTTSRSSYENSSSMTGCSGSIYDAIILSRARGEAYACVSVFQWSALSILSLACGQAAKSAENCAWYDSNHKINFPKGCNNGSRGDIDDSSVKFDQHSKKSSFGKTGSGVPFTKTTHNGQACGVADVNGCMYQPLLGVYQGGSGVFYVAKESYKMHDFTKDNCHATPNFDRVDGMWSGSGKWGNGTNGAFPSDTSGPTRAMCGVYPAINAGSDFGTDLFGTDHAHQTLYGGDVIFAAGSFDDASNAGVWCRSGGYWSNQFDYAGLRAAGYAQ